MNRFIENLQFYFQDEATRIFAGMVDLHDSLMYYLIIIVMFVFYFLVIRSKSVLKYWNHSTLIEIIWTLIPALILIIIAIPSFKLLYSLDEITNPELTIKAIGRQWYWNYEISDFEGININFDSYLKADDDLTLGELRLLEVDNKLVVPVNTPIRFLTTGGDVIHSFGIPALGIKIDSIPGRINQVTTLILKSGLYLGHCYELCGTGHALMPIIIEAVEPKDFISWLLTFTDLDLNLYLIIVKFFKSLL